MTPGIHTAWEFLMTGAGLILWAAVLYTVYRLSKWRYDELARKKTITER